MHILVKSSYLLVLSVIKCLHVFLNSSVSQGNDFYIPRLYNKEYEKEGEYWED